MKRKFLTVKNKAKLYKVLKTYLVEVIQEEGYLDSMDKVVADVVRVKCYKASPLLTLDKVEDYLRGLSLSIMYDSYTICKFLFASLNLEYEKENDKYIEESCDIDSWYWHCLAMCIYSNYIHVHEGGI